MTCYLLFDRQRQTQRDSTQSDHYEQLDIILNSATFDLAFQHRDFCLVNDPTPQVQTSLIYPQVIGSAIMKPSHFTERGDCPSFQMLYTFYGHGKLIYNDTIYPLPPSSLAIIDCRRPHRYQADDPEGWGYQFVHFAGGDYLVSQALANGPVFYALNGTNALVSFRELVNLTKAASSTFDLLANERITELLTDVSISKAQSQTTPPHSDAPAWFIDIKLYILAHYNEPLTIAELAERTGLSPSRFAHKFAELSGSSPMVYQRQLRMKTAHSLLATTNLTVNEIAHEVGYSSTQGFLSSWRKTSTMTPVEFRRYAHMMRSPDAPPEKTASRTSTRADRP